MLRRYSTVTQIYIALNNWMGKHAGAAWLVLIIASVALGFAPTRSHHATLARSGTTLRAKKRVRKENSGSASPDRIPSKNPISSRDSTDEDKLSMDEWMAFQAKKAATTDAGAEVCRASMLAVRLNDCPSLGK